MGFRPTVYHSSAIGDIPMMKQKLCVGLGVGLVAVLLAVHAYATCEEDCLAAYNAALQECVEAYNEALVQCNEALTVAETTRDKALATCKEDKEAAMTQCAGNEQVALGLCNDTAEDDLSTAGVLYTVDKYLCHGDPVCLEEAKGEYFARLQDIASALLACVDNAAQVRSECERLANTSFLGCQLTAEIAYRNALYEYVACRNVALEALGDCVDAVGEAYADCLAACGG
jgi:hypothetical protein